MSPNSSKFYSPKVNVAKEIRETALDFVKPEEIVREAISNAIDAGADEIRIQAYDDRSSGDSELVLEFYDTGIGMDESTIEGFFDLAFTKKPNPSTAIGEKGHGTKIYYNSSKVTVFTRHLNNPDLIIRADLDSPRQKLNLGAINANADPIQIKISRCTAEDLPQHFNSDHGTYIIVRGYYDNNFGPFEHNRLKDYILWFTAWGSVRPMVDSTRQANCRLYLKGIGKSDFNEVQYGHTFPSEQYDFSVLKEQYPQRPENVYVRRWILRDIQVENYPQNRIDVVFSVEGDRIKRDHNPMLKWLGKPNPLRLRSPDQYSVEERYGIYFCKDFLPIHRKNEEFAERSEWTKWHAFVNCQAFTLTANRASTDNTPPALLSAILKTAKAAIEDRIFDSDSYHEFIQKCHLEVGRRKAEKERSDVSRRLKRYKEKQLLKIAKDGQEFQFREPVHEQGVVWLLASILAKWPRSFPWRVTDIDQHFGYDFLIEKQHDLRAVEDCAFAECKFELRGDEEFNHSFKYLRYLICWDYRINGEDPLIDIAGAKALFEIAPKADDQPHCRYFLNVQGAHQKIEVIPLKKWLIEAMNLQDAQ